jgi:hypothetical protein
MKEEECVPIASTTQLVLTVKGVKKDITTPLEYPRPLVVLVDVSTQNLLYMNSNSASYFDRSYYNIYVIQRGLGKPSCWQRNKGH